MICALSQEAPRKGSRSGTSLRLHEHINSANVVIRNWEDYTGERAEIVPKKKKKISRATSRRLETGRWSDCWNHYRDWVSSLIVGDLKPNFWLFLTLCRQLTAIWVMSRLGGACLVSSFANPPSTRPLSIFSLHDCTAEKGVPSQQLSREP